MQIFWQILEHVYTRKITCTYLYVFLRVPHDNKSKLGNGDDTATMPGDGPDGGRVTTTNSFMAVKLNDQREIFWLWF